MNMLVGCMLVFREGPQDWDSAPLEPFINGMLEKGWRAMKPAFPFSYCAVIPVDQPVSLEELAGTIQKQYVAPAFAATFVAKEHDPVEALVDIRLIVNNSPDDAPFYQETIKYSFIPDQGVQLDIDFNANSLFNKDNQQKLARLLDQEVKKHTSAGDE